MLGLICPVMPNDGKVIDACCTTSSPVPPCVAAYLGGRARAVTENVIPIREPASRRKAA